MQQPLAKAPGTTVYAQFSAMRAADVQREARERRMVNALELLAEVRAAPEATARGVLKFVRAIAREGLGRDAAA